MRLDKVRKVIRDVLREKQIWGNERTETGKDMPDDIQFVQIQKKRRSGKYSVFPLPGCCPILRRIHVQEMLLDQSWYQQKKEVNYYL